jgi:hypothetical protein
MKVFDSIGVIAKKGEGHSDCVQIDTYVVSGPKVSNATSHKPRHFLFTFQYYK